MHKLLLLAREQWDIEIAASKISYMNSEKQQNKNIKKEKKKSNKNMDMVKLNLFCYFVSYSVHGDDIPTQRGRFTWPSTITSVVLKTNS